MVELKEQILTEEQLKKKERGQIFKRALFREDGLHQHFLFVTRYGCSLSSEVLFQFTYQFILVNNQML